MIIDLKNISFLKRDLSWMTHVSFVFPAPAVSYVRTRTNFHPEGGAYGCHVAREYLRRWKIAIRKIALSEPATPPFLVQFPPTHVGDA